VLGWFGRIQYAGNIELHSKQVSTKREITLGQLPGTITAKSLSFHLTQGVPSSERGKEAEQKLGQELEPENEQSERLEETTEPRRASKDYCP